MILAKVKVLLDALHLGATTREELEKRLTGLLYVQYRRQIDDIWAKRLQTLAKE